MIYPVKSASPFCIAKNLTGQGMQRNAENGVFTKPSMECFLIYLRKGHEVE